MIEYTSRVGALLFTGLLLAGCGDECNSSFDCPSGQVCVRGECVDGSPTDTSTDGDVVGDTPVDGDPDTGGDPGTDTGTDTSPDTGTDTSPDTASDIDEDDFPTDESFEEVQEDAPVFECWTDGDCDDLNFCTDDYCSASKECLFVPARDGVECSDGLHCNGIEVCEAGVCAADVDPCEDFNACTSHTCSEGTEGPECSYSDLADGTDCDNGNYCDGPDTCSEGECVSGPQPCDRFHTNPCMHWICDGASASCLEEALADGTGCSDGVECNGLEACLAGTCTPPPDAPCDDLNPCTTDTCDESGGSLTCTNTPVADGVSCGGSDPCDGTGRQCLAGTCTMGTGAACWDGDLCTLDRCDGSSGSPVCVSTTAYFASMTCGDTIAPYSLGERAEVSSYGSCGSGYDGPETVIEFSASTAPASVTVTYSPVYSHGTLSTLLLTDACTASSCFAHDTGLTATFASPGSSFYIVIEGFLDGDVTVTCP